MRPIAENERFAIWRLSVAGAVDIVLDKEEGRWALGTMARNAAAGADDEERQANIAEMARELGLELEDGSPAAAPEGPSFGM